MAHTLTLYDKAKVKMLDGSIDLDTDVIKVALLESGYTPDFDNDEFMDDANTYELNEGNGDTLGYYAGFGGDGRQTIASLDVTQISTGAKVDGDDVTFPALDAALPDVVGALIYKHDTSDAASPLIAYIEFDPDFDPDGTDLTIAWNTSGIFTAE